MENVAFEEFFSRFFATHTTCDEEHFSYSHHLSTVDFHASLCHTDWSPVFSRVGLTDQWSAFTQLLLPILDYHAPFQRLKIHNPSAPPASDTTLRLMAQRRGLLAREGRTPAFLTLDKRVKTAIKRDVRDDIASRVRRQGPTSTFRNQILK